MNSVNLMGRVTKDISLRQTPNGVNVCSFSIAVRRPHSSKNETDFFTCVAWRKLAETLSVYVKKGDMIGVTGYLYNRKHKGNDGVEREVTELNVDDISFSSSKSKTQETPSGINSDGFEDIEGQEDDLPF